MKVIIPFEFNRKFGGTQKAIVDIIKYGKHLNDFYALLPPKGNFDKELLKHGVKVFFSGNENYWPYSYKQIIKTIKNTREISKDLYSVVKQNSIEVVYTSMMPSLIAAIYTKQKCKNLKIIYHIRGIKISVAHKIILKNLANLIDYVVVNTEVTKEYIKDIVKSEKLIVIPDSTDFHTLNKNFRKTFSDRTVRIGLVARICRIKGHLQFVEIAKELININQTGNKKIEFFIGGDAISTEDIKYLEEVKKKIREYNLENYITFDGYVTDVNKYLKNIDILFCTTQYPGEGFGKIVIEAQANYIPVVAFNYGSMSEVIRHTKDGYVANDLKEFVGYAQMLIEDSQLRLSMGREGYLKVAEKYDAKTNNININNLFNSF